MGIAINVSNDSYQKKFVLFSFLKSGNCKFVEISIYRNVQEFVISRSQRKKLLSKFFWYLSFLCLLNFNKLKEIFFPANYHSSISSFNSSKIEEKYIRKILRKISHKIFSFVWLKFDLFHNIEMYHFEGLLYFVKQNIYINCDICKVIGQSFLM